MNLMVTPINRLSVRIIDPANPYYPSAGNNPKVIGNGDDRSFQAHVWIRNDSIVPVTLAEVTFRTTLKQGQSTSTSDIKESFSFSLEANGGEREFIRMVICPFKKLIVDGLCEVLVEVFFREELLTQTNLWCRIDVTDLYFVDLINFHSLQIAQIQERMKVLEARH